LHGVKEATTDLETIRGWWRQWPNANIGLATGVKSGVFVLDIDPKSGGSHNLEELEDAYGGLPGTLTQRTGSNGQHRIFRYPDVQIKNSASKIAPGLDIRSDGGYIVAAPSVHASGSRYEWHGVNTPVEVAPDWLIALILISEDEGEQETEQPSASPVVPVHGQIVKEGGRNDFLFRQARGLVISFSPHEVRRRVEAKNLGQCVPPVDEKELTKLLKSAERYGRLQVH
jgi:putative DNA primase/helicase